MNSPGCGGSRARMAAIPEGPRRVLYDVIDRLRPFVGNRAIAFQNRRREASCARLRGARRRKGTSTTSSAGGCSWRFKRPRVNPSTYDSRRTSPSLCARVTPFASHSTPERWVKPADRMRHARFAEETGGVYDPVRHQSALETLHLSRPSIDGPTPAERVAANVRRLERLERYQPATQLRNGRLVMFDPIW